MARKYPPAQLSCDHVPPRRCTSSCHNVRPVEHTPREMGGQPRYVPTATAGASALVFGLSLALLALAPSSTAAVRIGFVSDTGIGNDNPGDYWVDFYGNRQGPVYKVNGDTCYTFEGNYCRLYSRARAVIGALQDNGADLVVHAGDLDYESAPKMFRK